MEKKFRIIIEGSYKNTQSTTATKAIDEVMLYAQEHFDSVSKKCAFTSLAEVSVEDPEEIIVERWSIEDVIDRAKERGIKLSKKVAKEILYQIDHKHDACNGINWDVIDYYTDMRNDK
jgi:hypothetical protein